MAKLNKKLFPFGLDCSPVEGEVSEETKQWLIESGRATEEDFEQDSAKKPTKKTT